MQFCITQADRLVDLIQRVADGASRHFRGIDLKTRPWVGWALVIAWSAFSAYIATENWIARFVSLVFMVSSAYVSYRFAMKKRGRTERAQQR
jgi:hypothetical protein